jgi:four helix bundle protein
MAEILSFRDLDAWKVAMDLVVTTYEVSGRFPRTEQFALTSQMHRAAVSVPSNVAEGHATGPGRRYRNHIRIALGSLAEVATQVEIAIRLKYIDTDARTEIERQLTRTRQLLNGLHRSLRRRQLVTTALTCAAFLLGGATLLLS